MKMGKTKTKAESKSAPLLKKKRSQRTAEMNDAFLDKHLKLSIQNSLSDGTSLDNKSAKVYSSPFMCCSLKDFLLEGDSFITDLRTEVESLPFVAKINDLYSFQQTDDVRNCPGPCVAAFRSLLCTQVLSMLRQVTGIKLSDRVDATCSKYEDGDTLLCHDDELEGRRIAFIYYLMPEWSSDDGGCLDLFSVDEHGQPNAVVESIVPQPNMFNFFPVTLDSFHQVAEVLSRDKTRLSISGWFYGEPFHRPEPYVEPEPVSVSPLKDISLEEWINPVYFKPAVQAKIRKRFEKCSEAQLHFFLKENKYDEVCSALESTSTQWTQQGPANKRHFHACDPRCNDVLQSCTNLMSSEGMFCLLAKLTGMNLAEDRSIAQVQAPVESSANAKDAETVAVSATGGQETEEEDMLMCVQDDEDEGADGDEEVSDEDEEDDAEESEEEDDADVALGSPTVQASIRNWSPGCYTLLHDLEQQTSSMALDAQLYFKADEWQPDFGGFTCYVAKGDDEELLSIQPTTNSLALVCRDSDTMRFVKYINHTCPEPGSDSETPPSPGQNGDTRHSSFYDIALVYRE